MQVPGFLFLAQVQAWKLSLLFPHPIFDFTQPGWPAHPCYQKRKISFSPGWITFSNSRVMLISKISSGRLPGKNTLPVVKCSLLVAAPFPALVVLIPGMSPQHGDFSLLTQCSCFLLTFDIYKAGAKLKVNLPVTLLNVPF